MKLTDEQAAEIRRIFMRSDNRRETIKIQAELHACEPADILEALGKTGEDYTVVKSKVCYSKVMRQKVLDALKNGASQAEAAKKYGITPASVSLWVEAAKAADLAATKSEPAAPKEAPAPAPAGEKRQTDAAGQYVPQTILLAAKQLDAALQGLQRTEDILHMQKEPPAILTVQERQTLKDLRSKLQVFAAGYTCALQALKQNAKQSEKEEPAK